MRRGWVLTSLLFLVSATSLAAQGRAAPRLEGKWEARTDDGPRLIMVRADSSAQFGDQVARWRLAGDSIWLTVGDGVWMVYGLKVQADGSRSREGTCRSQ